MIIRPLIISVIPTYLVTVAIDIKIADSIKYFVLLLSIYNDNNHKLHSIKGINSGSDHVIKYIFIKSRDVNK